MKKILCTELEEGLPPRVFAYLLDERTIDIKRNIDSNGVAKHRFTIVGNDFTIMGTNLQGKGTTVIQVKNGKLVEEGLKFKEVEDDPVPPVEDGEPKPDATPEVKPEVKPKEDEEK